MGLWVKTESMLPFGPMSRPEQGKLVRGLDLHGRMGYIYFEVGESPSFLTPQGHKLLGRICSWHLEAGWGAWGISQRSPLGGPLKAEWAGH